MYLVQNGGDGPEHRANTGGDELLSSSFSRRLIWETARDLAEQRLRQTDQLLAISETLSLSPTKSLTTPLAQLADALLTEDLDPLTVEAFGEGMARVVEAQLAAFPKNIFADFDFLAAEVLRTARRDPLPYERVARTCATLAELMHIYGCNTEIRYQYVHDFLYGFDWERWIRKDPVSREGIGPFDPGFLERMVERGKEIIGQINQGDPLLPKLLPGEFRNSYAFSRIPADERRLFEHLAAQNLIPIEQWSVSAEPQIALPLSEIREREALRLGLFGAPSD